ncbi:MAG: hypothetical protein EKK40_01860 [Bradyrhizobiaceae bacterium]|nr:MAG: hypothetical protein EKK40_01860 [Bradyrhizobiaceae bacterium]
MFSVDVVQGNILNRSCDLLALKHADGFYGIDARISEAIGFKAVVPKRKIRVVPGRGIEARKVAFIGVGPLVEFDYAEIRKFGQDVIFLAAKHEDVRRICMPIHGPGYGLDEAEAFSSLVAGIFDASSDEKSSRRIESVEIVEINETRARRFSSILSELLNSNWRANLGEKIQAEVPRNSFKKFGVESDLKVRLFVAMPFKDSFNDEWEISIQEAANSLNMLCERIDKSAFVGDIASEIKRRIEQYDGLIALLNDANPNVFLEIGYAWAKNKPTLLLAKEGQVLPFDVKGQRCLFYRSIADLRSKLRSELEQLQSNGILRKT